MIKRRNLLQMAAATGWMSALGASAEVVRKPTRIFVGFPAGTGSDIFARQLAENLRGGYASTVVVENRAGAGGRIAMEAVKAAEADGSTLLLTPASTMILYPHVHKELRYNPLKDFTPVALLSTIKLGLAVGKNVPATTLAEYLQWCKGDPKRAAYGTSGAGTVPHFLGAMLGRAANVDLQHVAYKGASPARQDLVGGQIPAYIGVAGNDMISDHLAGRCRILALAEPRRTQVLPDIPTFAELGYKEMTAQEWLGLFAPAGTPAAVVDPLAAMSIAALKQPEFVKLLSTYAMEPGENVTRSFAERIAAEHAGWATVVKRTGFVPAE